MNPSHIPGCPTMITETMYKTQEDYVFLNNIHAKEFIYNPHFKREPEGPFIEEYYQHYEADKPLPNSLYSPIRIAKENVNRQCNPFVAYPFGVPHKYEKIICPKCKGNATFGKKKKSKKDKKNQENDLFTSSLKEENSNSIICWTKNKDHTEKNSLYSYTLNQDQQNLETASFKSMDPLNTQANEHIEKSYMEDEENFTKFSDIYQIKDFSELELSNSVNKPSSHGTEECIIRSESYSKYSNSHSSDPHKNTINNNNNNTYSTNYSKFCAVPNPISEGIITSNEFGSNTLPCRSMPEKVSSKGKGKLYLKLNNASISEYPNVLSSEGISESYPTDHNSEQAIKSDDTNSKERKKVKINVNGKSEKEKEKEKKKEPITQNETNELNRDNIHTMKKKSLKLKMNPIDLEKTENKPKTSSATLLDEAQGADQDTKRNKESTKKYRNKKNIPMRKISVSPTSVRKTSGETYLRMCKMQLAIDAQIKSNNPTSNGNKGMLTSEEELFGSNSPRNVIAKSRVIYRQEKQKEPKRKISKEGNVNTNQNLSVSPIANSIRNLSETSQPNSSVGPLSNRSLNINLSPKPKLNTNKEDNAESNKNQNFITNIKKRKTIPPNKIILKGNSKNDVETFTKKESKAVSPRKTLILKKNSKINSKNIYQKNLSSARKLSSKISNVGTTKKSFQKNSLGIEGNRDSIVPKKTPKNSISSSAKTSNASVNKILINNNAPELSKIKNGYLKRKSPAVISKSAEDNIRKITSSTSKGVNEIQTKKGIITALKKKKTIVEDTSKLGNKNMLSQRKETMKKQTGCVSDSALVNDSEERISKVEVKFGRSETKLYMPNHKIVPFKKTEVKMETKKDSVKMKTKPNGKFNRLDTATQRKLKELSKSKKNNTNTDMQSSLLSKNVKGTLKNKKKELFENIMLLSKIMAKKNDTEEKNTKEPENKNNDQDLDFDSDPLSNKLKRVQTLKDKKKELTKKERRESIGRNLKKKEKIIEKKEKKGVEQE